MTPPTPLNDLRTRIEQQLRILLGEVRPTGDRGVELFLDNGASIGTISQIGVIASRIPNDDIMRLRFDIVFNFFREDILAELNAIENVPDTMRPFPQSKRQFIIRNPENGEEFGTFEYEFNFDREAWMVRRIDLSSSFPA